MRVRIFICGRVGAAYAVCTCDSIRLPPTLNIRESRFNRVNPLGRMKTYVIRSFQDLLGTQNVLQAENTFILSVDGDVTFKPDAVRLLVDRSVIVMGLSIKTEQFTVMLVFE